MKNHPLAKSLIWVKREHRSQFQTQISTVPSLGIPTEQTRIILTEEFTTDPMKQHSFVDRLTPNRRLKA